MDNRRTNKKRAGAVTSEPPNAKSVQRPHATRRSGGITSSWRGCGGRRRSWSSNWKPTSEIGVERKVSDSTLWARVPIKRAYRCVRVPAPGWGSSNRACRHAKAPPSGPGWIHEIKHDGFRILARRDSTGVRLITREVCMSDPARVQGLVPLLLLKFLKIAAVRITRLSRSIPFAPTKPVSCNRCSRQDRYRR